MLQRSSVNASSVNTSADAPDSVLVVGAGVSGLSAALLLARRGVAVEIWEAGEEPGGILSPVDFRGHEYDRGSHRVHPDSHPLLRELTSGEDWEERPRNGKLVLNGRHIPYPIDPISFMRGLGIEATIDMGLGWLTRPTGFRRFLDWEDARQETPTGDKGFEQFVVERVGESAYRRFYRPYVEKVWGEDPDRISQSVAKQRVSTSNPLKSMLKSIGLEDETFLYPRRGMAGLTESFAEQVRDEGVEIHYGRRYEPERDASSETAAPNGHDAVVYTGYLPELVADSDLDHRGLYLLHVAFPEDAIDDTIDTWYVPEPDYWFGRVSQPENFSPDLASDGESVLCVEIPEGRWGRGVDFTERIDEVIDQLADAEIVEAGAEIGALRQTYLPRVYPNYVRDWYAEWESTMDEVREMGEILPVGRQGLFLHCNMDHCVSIAADVVDHLTAGRPHDEWFDRCSDYLDLRVRD